MLHTLVWLACVQVALTGLLEIGKTLPEEDYSKQVGWCTRGDVHTGVAAQHTTECWALLVPLLTPPRALYACC